MIDTSLAPSAVLCELIPKGEFENSFFVWALRTNGEEYQLTKRTVFVEAAHKCYPAPTMQEVLYDLATLDGDEDPIVRIEWNEMMSSDSPAGYALEQWLKVKGIK